MIKKIIIFITIIFITLPTSTHANEEVGNFANNWFKTFSTKIDTKYNTQNEILYFKELSKRLNLLLVTRHLNTAQIKLVNDLTKLSNEYIFNKQKYLKEESNIITIQENPLINNFKNKSFNDDHIFLENWVWYSYIFKSNLYFNVDNNKLNRVTLEWNNINKYSSLVFVRKDNKFWFANNYVKRKLISDNIIYWIAWKYNFLKELKDDKKELNYDTDEVLKKLKEETKKITKGKTEEEKIKIIYNYVISNISYTKNFTLDQARIFSWIQTYINKNWVCEWYTKLFLYMLNFANIDNVEVIRWYVLDAPDFPKIWHAWVRIGDKYYDPTFDDPIWQLKTKDFSEYNYFWLPSDLFYTNRYNFEKIPSFLKSEWLSYRKNFINKRIASLLFKYKDSWYNILKPFLLKYENKIDLNKTLDISDLKKIMWYYDVSNWKFIKNWIIKEISHLNYYTINDLDVENIINQLNYNLNWYYLFHWKLDNWNYEYRLAYNIIFN